jgi:molybdopterin synthase catalytic subunit
MQARVVIQTEDFNVAEVLTQLRAQDLRVGAVCSFVGTVRDTRMLTGQASDEVVSMALEHYPGMTESSIEAMIDEAHQRAGSRHLSTPRRKFQSLRVFDGLLENASTVLEKRRNA